MYLKAHERFKDGKRHMYYSLTESLRVSRKRVVQRTVLHLGELNTTQVEQWQRTISELVQRDAWVMDGNYGGTLDVRMSAADTVVFLDVFDQSLKH